MRRVARRGEDPQGERGTESDLVAVVHGSVRERHRLTGGDEIGHVQLAGERPSARDIVVVDVGLGDAGDPDTRCKGCAEEAIDVALGVDGHRNGPVMDEVGAVTELGCGYHDHIDHRRLPSRPLCPGNLKMAWEGREGCVRNCRCAGRSGGCN